MISLILTVDYELFGNGSGSVDRCVVDPTRVLLDVAERHGAPVTLFVEALEFQAMARVATGESTGPERDARRVREQLREAVRRGHDVQLHLHPQWADARLERERWELDLDRWRIGDLARSEVQKLIREGRDFLEAVIRPVQADYRPRVFRAGAWCIQPSGVVLAELEAQGFRIDSSVAPGLRRADPSNWYDFRRAPRDRATWKVSEEVDRPARASRLLEIPIAVGRVGAVRHLRETVHERLGRAGDAPVGCSGDYGGRPGNLWDRLAGAVSRLATAHLSMLDVCRLPTDSMLAIADQWRNRRAPERVPIPLVAIGHTKNFGSRAAERLDEFLARLERDPDVSFSTFEPWIYGPAPGLTPAESDELVGRGPRDAGAGRDV